RYGAVDRDPRPAPCRPRRIADPRRPPCPIPTDPPRPGTVLALQLRVMPVIVSVASGKGGVGKSAAVCNLGVVLARLGRAVVLADLDVGGANLHVLLGSFAPERTLSDFLTRRVPRLADVVQPVEFCRNLRLLPGAAESLESANPHHASRSRLLR